MSEQKGPKILTTAEIAKKLRVDPKTVRDLISSGQLPAYKVGKQYRILANDLKEFWRAASTLKGINNA